MKYVTTMLAGFVLLLASTAMAQGEGKNHNMPSFADFDLDGNGAISEDEFYKAHAERIAERVQEGHQMKGMVHAPTFADIDTDDDGAVSRDEFAAHQAEHHGNMHADGTE